MNTNQLSQDNTTVSKKFKRITIPPCPWHTQDKLGYLAAHEDANKRMSNGERQSQCHVCGYWFWPHEFGIDPISKIKKL